MVDSRKWFWEGLSRVLPKSEFGDLVFSWVKFVRVHRRVPSRNRRLFNDMLYTSKLAPEILNPIRSYSTDKELFKRLVKAELGEKYVVPTLAVFHTEADVSEFQFPDSFCAKPTHMSGEVEIVRNGTPDRAKIKSWLHMSHYPTSRERNYKYLTPKVIVEPLIFGEDDVSDYRIFCFEGKPKLICVDIGKYSNYSRAFYTTDWSKQNYSLGYQLHIGEVAKPDCLGEMLDAAETLSRDLNFVRVDFYTNGTDFFLGELTHSHASASQRFIPVSAEKQASQTIFG